MEIKNEWHSRGYLPHRDKISLLQSITFRLADGLPQNILNELEKELLSESNEKQDIERREKIEYYLDSGMGCCALANPKMATVMQNTLLYYDNKNYKLIAWCIMPNHVHVLIEPYITLSEIVKSWKSYTGKWAFKYNEELNLGITEKIFWMREYWDRYIRDEKHYDTVIKYIHNNPVKAKLCSNPENWEWSSVGIEEPSRSVAVPEEKPSRSVAFPEEEPSRSVAVPEEKPSRSVAVPVDMKQIGVIKTPFKELQDMPIQPKGAKGIKGSVEVFSEYADGLLDIDGFSHIILLYQFHQAKGFKLQTMPFLEDVVHGVFATRAPKRPNQIGMSIVKLISKKDNILEIEEVDILDGTPLIDIKPFVPNFDAQTNVKVGWLEKHHNKVNNHKSDGRFIK